jgi:hypothetical protein
MISLPTVDVLDSITIPVHCPIPWEEMRGDDHTRYCLNCSESVHDVSTLTTEETLKLLTAGGKSPCIRIYRRNDGRVMTADCPASAREKMWRWLRRRSTWAASVFALLFVSGCRTATQGLYSTEYRDAVMNTLPQTTSDATQSPVARP